MNLSIYDIVLISTIYVTTAKIISRKVSKVGTWQTRVLNFEEVDTDFCELLDTNVCL